MPIQMTTTQDMVFTRRADPDPNVIVGEAYTVHNKYDYTWLCIGPLKLKMHGDRAMALRTLALLAQELNDKLEGFSHREGPPAGSNGFSGEDITMHAARPHVVADPARNRKSAARKTR